MPNLDFWQKQKIRKPLILINLCKKFEIYAEWIANIFFRGFIKITKKKYGKKNVN